MRKQLTTTRLPNNQEVFCLEPEEANILYQQVQRYLNHGITIKEGDTIFDVGANIGLFTLMVNELCKGNGDRFNSELFWLPKIFRSGIAIVLLDRSIDIRDMLICPFSQNS